MANNNEQQLSKLPRFDSLVKNRATLPVFIIRAALDEAVLLGNSECARYYYSVSNFNNIIEIFKQCLLSDSIRLSYQTKQCIR